MTDTATKTPEERALEIVEAWIKTPIHETPKLEDVIAAALRQTERETWLKAAEVAEKSEYTITGNMIGAELRRRAEEAKPND